MSNKRPVVEQKKNNKTSKINKKPFPWFGVIAVIFIAVFIISLMQIENNKREYFAKEKDECKNTTLNYQFDENKGECLRADYDSKQVCVNNTAGKIYTSTSDLSDNFTLYSNNYTIPDYDANVPYYYVDCYGDGSWNTVKIAETTTLDYVSKYVWAKQEEKTSSKPGNYSCVDVTSYDHNWSNDMYCTAPDGTHFYTSYEEAEALMKADYYDSMYDDWYDPAP